MNEPFKVGAEIEIGHPFVRETYRGYDEGGSFERLSWRPGIRHEMIAPDDSEAVADGIGTQIVTIISIHKPGRYPARVFFTRRWRDPDGHEFGKGKLHIMTSGALRARTKGYRHRYRLNDAVMDQRKLAGSPAMERGALPW